MIGYLKSARIRLSNAWPSGGDTKRLSGIAFLIRVISAVIAYGSQVLLARWMGGAEFGIYIYAWTWLLLLGSCIDMGMSSAAQRLIPEYSRQEKQALLRGFLALSRWLSVAVAVLVGLLCAAIIKVAEPWLNAATVTPLYLACATLPAFALTLTQSGISRSYDWIGLALSPTFLVRQLLILAIPGLMYASGILVDSTSAMLATCVAAWVTALGSHLVLDRRLSQKIGLGPHSYDVRNWFAVSLPLFLVEALFLVFSYVDVLILAQFLPPADTAGYYAAAKTLAIVSFIHFSVAAATTHRFSQYQQADDHARLRALLAQTTRWTFWPSLLATVFLLSIGRPLLDLFGAGFADSYPLMFIFALGLLARAAVGPSERLLCMVGAWRACAFVYLIVVILNVSLCLALIPFYGALGGAIATSTAFVMESVLLFIVTRWRLRMVTPLHSQSVRA